MPNSIQVDTPLSAVETKTVRLFDERNPLKLQSGESLSPIDIAYETYGTLNPTGTNAMLICHALTANAHAAGLHKNNPETAGWWDPLIGPGKAFDTDKYFVICSNILGSCYGTTGPSSVNPRTGAKYRLAFPDFTIRDIVTIQKSLVDFLGVKKLASVAGSSLGGMQVLEWGVTYPDFCETIIPISTAAEQSPWCIALNSAARAGITSDAEWQGGFYVRQPSKGLSVARMVGMISYRSAEEFGQRFGRKRRFDGIATRDVENPFEIESYLTHQGLKLAERFDANTYLYLSHATDSHDLCYGRGDIATVLGNITAKALCIGVSTDIRYPPREQKELALHIPDATYAEIQSIHGHDAFLIEFDQLASFISDFLETKSIAS
jgi:homoserine O-acetyltransferase